MRQQQVVGKPKKVEPSTVKTLEQIHRYRMKPGLKKFLISKTGSYAFCKKTSKQSD
jgi:hypothetical protein